MADSTETRKEQRAAARAERARAEADRARTKRRLWQLGGVLAVAAIVVAVVIVVASGGGGSGTTKKRAGEKVPGQRATAGLLAGIPQHGITLGNPKAPVTLVEFADLQCPFCRDYTNTLLPTLINSYVRPGKVKMEFRNISFIGTDSLRAAQMAAAAGLQSKLWSFVDLFYANQGEENSGYVTDEFLRKIGSGIGGLNVEKAMNDRATATVQKQLNQAQQLAAANGVSSTPSFLVGRTGGKLEAFDVRAFTLDQFAIHIDPLLSK